MANGDRHHRPHLFTQDTRHAEGYTAKNLGGGKRAVVPPKDRLRHAGVLRAQLAHVSAVQRQRVSEQQAAGLIHALGIQVEFESEPDLTLAAASLARDSRGIELMNVRQQGSQLLATVFVPPGRLAHFEKLLTEYVDHKVNKHGKPLDHQALVDTIRALRVATFDSLWTDDAASLPVDPAQAIWWEAWIPIGSDSDARFAELRRLAVAAGLQVSDRVLKFPERLVAQLHGTRQALQQSTLLLTMIAELRRAKTTAEFFYELELVEQIEWHGDLRRRLQADSSANTYVTLLDTGVNNGHPLLAPFVAEEDRHCIEPAWGPDDTNGHGSELAGLALLGDLTPALAEDAPLQVPHRLESVRVLRFGGDNEGESFGAITAEAVARVEITDAARRRVFAMALTSTDGRDRGRPSSWSSQIDRLAGNYDDAGDTGRLFVLCAGNIQDAAAWATYPASLSTSSIHDPGQAWNALTVGAYSNLTTISPKAPAYTPVARAGGLSPYTTTSATWQSEWPFKPDLVMEGGNVGIDPSGFTSSMDSLSLLTTGHQPHQRLFTVSWATSAATALAAGMCARIASAYPAFWPETIRGMMVHSARWTQPMLDAYMPRGERNPVNMRQLLRHCGYGVPSLERALYSASNSLTLIVQDAIQPYHLQEGKVKTCEMHWHDLPWPIDVLQELGDLSVTLRVTLSHFVEPNPGERGNADKYAYQSHALRFAVRRPLETAKAFRLRINAQAFAGEPELPGEREGDPGWTVGARLRTRGSLHSDTWKGTAAQLANRSQLAIYPAMGWWRNRPSHGRFDRKVRYSLLVSIEAPGAELDLYAIVASKIMVRSEARVMAEVT